MNGLVIGVYGLYIILVGLKGNAGQLAGKVQDDAPKFLPWIIAIFVLAFLYNSSDAGRKITGPFIFLVLLAFVLKRFDTLKSQSVQLWNLAAAQPGSSANSSIGGGDKVAPAGTMNQAGGNQTLGSSAAVNNAITSLNNSFNSPNFQEYLFALENTL